MSDEYSFLGLITMEAGSWADWFAGTMSFAAVATALGGYWIADRQRKTDIVDRQRRAGISIGWKTLALLNQTNDVAQHIRTSLQQSNLPPGVMRFMHVRPLGMSTAPIAGLSTEEVEMLIEAKADEFLMDLSKGIATYDSIQFAMNEYRNRHEALFELLPPPIMGDGALFTHKLDREQHERYQPYAMMLDLLLTSIIDLTEENMSLARQLCDKYPAIMKAKFGKWNFEFTVGDEAT